MLIQHLITDAVSVFTYLRQRRVGQIFTCVLAGVGYLEAMKVIRRDIVQQRRQRPVTGAVGIHDLFRAAHIRRDMRKDAQRLLTILLAHRPAELILVEFRNRARQQRVIRFTFEFIFGKARHVEPGRPGGAEHQIDPLQRHIGCQQRILFTGQRKRLFFIHCDNRDVIAQEIAPELRVILNDIFCTQR